MSVIGGGSNTEPPVTSSSIKSKVHTMEANVLDDKFEVVEEVRNRLYVSKGKKKLIRVLTVTGYIFTVSLAAITLSVYYVFFYPGYLKPKANPTNGTI